MFSPFLVDPASAATGTIEFDQSGYYVGQYANYTGLVSDPSGWDSYRANLINPAGTIVDFYDVPTASLSSFADTFSIPLSYAGTWYINLVSCPYGVCNSWVTSTLSGMYIPVIAVSVPVPKAIISYSTSSDYILGSTLNYTVSYTNPNTDYVYQIRAENLYNGATIILKSEYGSSLTTSGSFVISSTNFEAMTNYRLRVFEVSTGSYIGNGNIFHTIAAATTTESSIVASPIDSYVGDSVYVSGYARSTYGTSMKVFIYPATGTTEIQATVVSGAFNIDYILPEGAYRAVLRELIPAGYSNAGQWQVIILASFNVYAGSIGTGKTLSINIIDPEGNNDGISETVMGGILSFSYTNVTATDRVTISSPSNSIYYTYIIGSTGSVSETTGGYSVMIPDTINSIGVWTVKIANGSDLSDIATDTIMITQENIFIELNSSVGSATLITPVSIGCNIPTTIRWHYNGTQTYNVTIYTLDPVKQYYNQAYPSPDGAMMYRSLVSYYVSVNSMGFPLAVAYVDVTPCGVATVNATAIPDYQQPGADGVDYMGILDSYVDLLGWGVNSFSRLAFSIIVMIVLFSMGMLMFKSTGGASVLALGAFAIFTAVGFIPIWIIIVLVLVLASKVLR